jgi:hypothetical protein
MRNSTPAFISFVLVALLAVAVEANEPADDGALKQGVLQLGAETSWHLADARAVRRETIDWLASVQKDDAVLQRAESIWPEDAEAPSDGAELLRRVTEIYALADPRARALVENCRGRRRTGAALPPADWLSAKETPAPLRYNLRLLYGRWLAQEQLYDECLAQLAGTEPADVIDPASLLFYRAVANHRLLNVDEARADLARLLEQQKRIPRRYASLARLMKADLADVKDDSLDHIARRMDDIGRRLELGRASGKVRELEDGVIESLDKLIKKMEDEQKKDDLAQQRPASGRSNPAERSDIRRLKGEGKVEAKDIGNSSDWIALPPKQREEVLQRVGRDYPSHYRSVIEEYYRQIAEDQQPKP